MGGLEDAYSKMLTPSEVTHQGYSQDLREGVRGAAGGCEPGAGTGGLEPGLLAGPHDVTQGQYGCSQAKSWPIDGHHDGLSEVQEGSNEIPEIAYNTLSDVWPKSPCFLHTEWWRRNV